MSSPRTASPCGVKAPGTYRALCPFHQERTPSFWIDARDVISSSTTSASAARRSGDIITFVMEREGCSFQEACERLSTRGDHPCWSRPAERVGTRRRAGWEELSAESVEARVLDQALQVYETALWETPVPGPTCTGEVSRKKLLEHSGLAMRTATPCWADSRRKSPRGPAVGRGAPGSGAGATGAEGDEPVDREFFLDRLIIPELRQGRPIWCIGRAMEEPPRRSTAEGSGGTRRQDRGGHARNTWACQGKSPLWAWST